MADSTLASLPAGALVTPTLADLLYIESGGVAHSVSLGNLIQNAPGLTLANNLTVPNLTVSGTLALSTLTAAVSLLAPLLRATNILYAYNGAAIGIGNIAVTPPVNGLIVQGAATLSGNFSVGGSLTANLAVDNGVTIDGVDISALASTGGGVVTLNGVQSLANKTLVTPTITDLTNVQHAHLAAASGGALSASAIASGILPQARGGTYADLSATGGTGQYLKQVSVGAAVTVGVISDADLPATIVRTTRAIVSGAGLVGGGDLSADRTVSVGAGLGITVNADDVALTTPGSLDVASPNSATGSHTHAITSSSNPGAAASLLASSAGGGLSLTGALSLTGNLTKVNNVATSFPASQGAANTSLHNDGAGNLAWAALNAAEITSGQLAVTRGGTNADLSATGGAGQYLKQASVGSAITVGAVADGDLPATIVRTSRSLVAGAGLTGAGDLSSDKTINVGAGLGITVNADDVALTTPGSLSVSSPNSATGSHTHALTSSSNPGAAASLLASNSSGGLSLSGALALVGNLTKINNVDTSFPASQGAANTSLHNDGAGTLVWRTPTAADITSGQLALPRGGTGADLSATGGAGQYLKQAGAGAAVTVGAIADADMPATVVRTPRAIVSGAGLTGGGDLTADRTLNVVAGDTSLIVNADELHVGLAATSGLQVSSGLMLADTVAGAGLAIASKVLAVGTPSALSAASANSSSGTTHSHSIDATLARSAITLTPSGLGLSGGGDLTANRTVALTSSSNPGVAASILASDASGNLTIAGALASTGNLTLAKINNVLTSFPSVQGGANTVWQNDGSGNLSWGKGAAPRFLGANSSVGATSIAMVSAPNATDSLGWVVIDAFTTECEIRKVTTVSGTTINFAAALVYAHATNDNALIVHDPTVFVKWFGAVADGVADDYTAAQRAVNVNYVNSGLPRNLRVVFPPQCRIGTSLNLTDREDLLIEGSTGNSKIIGACAGKAVFDMTGAGYCTVRNLEIFGDATNPPSVGIWTGRTTTNENAGSNVFENVECRGNFTYGGFYNIVGELARYSRCVVDLYGFLTTTRFSFCTSGVNEYSLVSDYSTPSATVTNFSVYLDDCFFEGGPTVTTNFEGVVIGRVSTVYIRGGYFTSWGASAIKLVGNVYALHVQDLLIEGTTLTNTIHHAAVAGAGTLNNCTLDNCFFATSSNIWSSDAGTDIRQIEINNMRCVIQAPATVPTFAFATVDMLYMRSWGGTADQGAITATNMYDSEIWLRVSQTLTISGTRRSVNVRQDSGYQSFDLKADFLKGARITGSENGFGGGELRLNGGAGTQNALTTNATGAPTMEFDHLGTANTGAWLWKNGTGAATTAMTLGASGVLTPAGGIVIGAGNQISKHLSVTGAWDAPSIADGTVTSTTLTVTGAVLGDTVAVGLSTIVSGALLFGAVTAANTVTVTLFNKTGGVLDLASGLLRADVWQH